MVKNKHNVCLVVKSLFIFVCIKTKQKILFFERSRLFVILRRNISERERGGGFSEQVPGPRPELPLIHVPEFQRDSHRRLHPEARFGHFSKYVVFGGSHSFIQP